MVDCRSPWGEKVLWGENVLSGEKAEVVGGQLVGVFFKIIYNAIDNSIFFSQ